ncbi:MAG: hypothetical protein Q4G21_09305 [Dermabacter sp.]|nr:hypothetical protein [Dermabacter sp.]
MSPVKTGVLYLALAVSALVTSLALVIVGLTLLAPQTQAALASPDPYAGLNVMFVHAPLYLLLSAIPNALLYAAGVVAIILITRTTGLTRSLSIAAVVVIFGGILMAPFVAVAYIPPTSLFVWGDQEPGWRAWGLVATSLDQLRWLIAALLGIGIALVTRSGRHSSEGHELSR